jgi:hypothetical protein
MSSKVNVLAAGTVGGGIQTPSTTAEKGPDERKSSEKSPELH